MRHGQATHLHSRRVRLVVGPIIWITFRQYHKSDEIHSAVVSRLLVERRSRSGNLARPIRRGTNIYLWYEAGSPFVSLSYNLLELSYVISSD